jgi:hypothetical protein
MRVARLLPLLLPGLLAVGATAGCGKQGPPLAPIIRTPAAVAPFEARRLEDTVYIRVVIPDKDASGMSPADLERIEVYAYTALTTSAVLDVKRSTHVATVPVQAPPTEADVERWRTSGVPPPPRPGEPQGSVVVVTEPMTEESLILLEPEKPKKELTVVTRNTGVLVTPPLVGPIDERRRLRNYTAQGISRKGVKGAMAAPYPIVLVPPPSSPRELTIDYTEHAVVLTWLPPVEQRERIQEPSPCATVPATPTGVTSTVATPGTAHDTRAATAAPPKGAATMTSPGAEPGARATAPVGPAKTPATGVPSGEKPAEPDTAGVMPARVAGAEETPSGGEAPCSPLAATPKGVPVTVVYSYNVYLVPSPTAPTVPETTGGASVTELPGRPWLVPLNAPPLNTLTYDDPAMVFGQERCYVVRSQDPQKAVESVATAPVCVTPIDRFPPPVPASLTAVASEGGISLIWDSVTATDLAGYVVMRSEGVDGPMVPLFETPIRETAYRDNSAKPGVRYVYVVVSVDTATPRNQSAPSNRVDDSAR